MNKYPKYKEEEYRSLMKWLDANYVYKSGGKDLDLFINFLKKIKKDFNFHYTTKTLYRAIFLKPKQFNEYIKNKDKVGIMTSNKVLQSWTTSIQKANQFIKDRKDEEWHDSDTKELIIVANVPGKNILGYIPDIYKKYKKYMKYDYDDDDDDTILYGFAYKLWNFEEENEYLVYLPDKKIEFQKIINPNKSK